MADEPDKQLDVAGIAKKLRKIFDDVMAEPNPFPPPPDGPTAHSAPRPRPQPDEEDMNDKRFETGRRRNA